MRGSVYQVEYEHQTSGRRSVAASGGILGIRGDHAAEDRRMFVFRLACLALFSVISILLGNEDPRPGEDPRSDIPLFTRYAR